MARKAKLVGYCRVSTENQKEEGTIEVQKEALKEYVKENKRYRLVEVFCDEQVSEGFASRPALDKLFDYLEDNKEVEGVLVYKLDRLAQDLYIQEHMIRKLESLNKKLYSLKEPNLDGNDPMRKVFRQFLEIISGLDKAFIAMRLSGKRVSKAQKGGYGGGAPALGYRTEDKDLKVDREQAETVKTIFRMKRYGKMGYREIARELNNKKIPTVRGGKWHGGCNS